MYNKQLGTKFEKEFAKILSQYGSWVRLDKGTAQTCDMIAARNNTAYLFECKTCYSNYYDISRTRDNQTMSRERFLECGNENAWFVYEVAGKEIYLSKDPISKPTHGIELEEWLNDNLFK